MLQRPCRLSIADKYYGDKGGGGSDINVPSLGQQIKETKRGFKKDILPLFRTFGNQEPLLKAQTEFAKAVGPQQAELLANIPSAAGYRAPLETRAANLIDIAPTLDRTQAALNPILTSLGETTPEQKYRAQQESAAQFAAQGNLYGNQYNIADVLNQQKYKDARLQAAIGNTAALQSLQGGDIAARLGLTQGIQGVTGTDIQQRAGLADAISKLYGGAEASRTGNFATLINPLYGLAGQQLGAQTQANIAEGQAQASGKAGKSGLAGSAIGAVGTVAAAAF